jgi:hypothetical protein
MSLLAAALSLTVQSVCLGACDDVGLPCNYDKTNYGLMHHDAPSRTLRKGNTFQFSQLMMHEILAKNRREERGK